MEDVAITFDPKQFTTALQAIVDKLGVMEKAVVKTGVKTNVTAGMMAKGMMMAAGGIGLALATAKKILSHIPEVGKSFQIAGDIIMQNLLWPLRKELIPLLQKMLNWVRDHRAMFVMWGSVLANIFRILRAVVTAFFDLFNRVFQKIAMGIKKIFGDTVKSVMDVINIILFKIIAVMAFVMAVLEPVFDFLGEAIVFLIKGLKNFFDGFMEGITGIGTPIDMIITAIKEIVDSIGKLGISMNDVMPVFKALGSLLGSLVHTVFALVAEILNDISLSIKKIAPGIQAIKGMKDLLMAKTPEEKNAALAQVVMSSRAIDDINKEQFERSKRLWSGVGKSWAGTGQNIVNAGLVAGAPTTSNSSKVTNVNGVTVNINAPGANSKEISQNVGKAITGVLKDEQYKTGSQVFK